MARHQRIQPVSPYDQEFDDTNSLSLMDQTDEIDQGKCRLAYAETNMRFQLSASIFAAFPLPKARKLQIASTRSR